MRAILLILLPVFALAQDPCKNVYSRSAWEDRDKWQRADELIALLQLPAAAHVADIGCHEGYMTFKLARRVGQEGNVYAVDVNESRLEKLRNHISESELRNVAVIKGDYDNPKLPENTLDAAIIIDAYHEMDDHDEILRHIKVALKSQGRLLLCEPIADSRRDDSRADQERRHELGMKYALEDLKKAGFVISFQKDPYIDRSSQKGDKMWVIVAVKP